MQLSGVARVAAATPSIQGAPPAATIAAMVFAGGDEICKSVDAIVRIGIPSTGRDTVCTNDA